MICQKFSFDTMPKLKTHCRIFPSIADRAYWEKAARHNLEWIENHTMQSEATARKLLTATLYREYTINGNRSRYEEIYMARRAELVRKTVLTCFYNDDRYMDDIADLLWMILEESTWTLPAHNYLDEKSDALPNLQQHFLDLFLAETACTLAFVYQTIGDKLDAISRVFRERIKIRVTSEAIDNFLTQNHYWWMGNRDRIDNWNPWICSNILAASLILIDDTEKLCQLVHKVMRVLDYYIEKYPQDGACDEGASYWSQAGLSMLECLWLLKIVSDGEINFFGEEKVNNTLTYLEKVHTGGDTCINFADCTVHVSMYYATIYKMAQLAGNDSTITFAKFLMETADIPDGIFGKVFRLSDFLTYRGEMAEMENKVYVPVTDSYFESTQVAVAKTDPNPENALFLAAKGGHNDECHNHNDVGSFIVYKNGTRFLVDAGNMVYTKETFSANRYGVWTNRSMYHNVPIIGGKEQKYGEEYSAADVTYQKMENKVLFSMKLHNAYENRDEIENWERCIVLDKKTEEIYVTETFDLQKEMPIALRFLTPQKPEVSENTVILSSPEGETLTMEFTGAEFAFSVEEILCDDAKIKESWPNGVRAFSVSAKGKQGTIRYSIK